MQPEEGFVLPSGMTIGPEGHIDTRTPAEIKLARQVAAVRKMIGDPPVAPNYANVMGDSEGNLGALTARSPPASKTFPFMISRTPPK